MNWSKAARGLPKILICSRRWNRNTRYLTCRHKLTFAVEPADENALTRYVTFSWALVISRTVVFRAVDATSSCNCCDTSISSTTLLFLRASSIASLRISARSSAGRSKKWNGPDGCHCVAWDCFVRVPLRTSGLLRNATRRLVVLMFLLLAWRSSPLCAVQADIAFYASDFGLRSSSRADRVWHRHRLIDAEWSLPVTMKGLRYHGRLDWCKRNERAWSRLGGRLSNLLT